MAIIFQEMTAEIPEATPRPPQPHASEARTPDQNASLDRLRAALLRDAQRQARLWAD